MSLRSPCTASCSLLVLYTRQISDNHIERTGKEPVVSGAAMKRRQVCQEAIETVSDGLNKLSKTNT